MEPVAINLGFWTIHWYGVLVATGFLVGLWTASRRALLVNVSPDTILNLGPWLIGGAIVGSRLLHVLSYWQEEYAQKPIWEIFMVHHGGLVFYGGLIGASLTIVLYTQIHKLALWTLADILAPSIALGHAFGRLGCLMNGCCYGRACAWPWAIHFPQGHETFGHGVHPTQIYESLLNLALYALLAWLFRRKQFAGQVFALYLIAYALLRSTVEYFRGDYALHYLSGMVTVGQMVSVAVLASGLWLWWWLSAKSKSAQTKT